MHANENSRIQKSLEKCEKVLILSQSVCSPRVLREIVAILIPMRRRSLTVYDQVSK